MSVKKSKKKSGTPLIIAIVLAVVIFIVSIKPYEQIGAKFEFLMFFVFELSLLSYIVRGKSRKVALAVWPIIIGIFYAMFNKWYSVAVLDYAFSGMALWLNATAVLLAGFIYVAMIGYKKDVLWEGKDDGTHEEEIIKLAEEKNMIIKEGEDEDSEIEPAEKKVVKKKSSAKKDTKEKAKEESEKEAELSEKVEELDEAPAVAGYESENVFAEEAAPTGVSSAEGDDEDAPTGVPSPDGEGEDEGAPTGVPPPAPTGVPSPDGEGEDEGEEDSYFNLNNENDFRKDSVAEKDLSEEVGDILDDFENEDDLEEKKEDLSEGMSVDFEKAENEDKY